MGEWRRCLVLRRWLTPTRSRERKNPLSLIEAYKNAFGNRQDVQLLIKSAHSAEHKKELHMLQRACSGANISIMDAVMTRQDKEG